MNPIHENQGEDAPHQTGIMEMLLRRIGRRLDQDEALRADLRELVLLLAASPTSETHEPVENGEEALEKSIITGSEETNLESPPAAVAQPLSPPLVEQVALESLVQVLEQGGSPPPQREEERIDPTGTAPPEVILQRLALKREAVELARRRAEDLKAGDAVPNRARYYAQVIAKARSLPNCYLWTCHAQHEGIDSDHWAELGGCFRAMESGLQTAIAALDIPNPGDFLSDALHHLAEAQCALRVKCAEFHYEDTDQVEVFEFLRRVTYERQIFISRYMQYADKADPATAGELLDRIEALSARIEARTRRDTHRQQALNRIRYELKRAGHDLEEKISHWHRVFETVNELVLDGLPPSHPRLRELLLPHLDDMPEEEELPLSDAMRLVLREMDTYLATQERTAHLRAETPEPTAELERARRVLEGTVMVIIGGDCRHEARRGILRAFGLKGVNWIETRPHETTSQFEAAVARDDVRVVLLAIRWSSHSYGEVKHYCDRYGKVLVRLPRGYGINQIARELCLQGAVPA